MELHTAVEIYRQRYETFRHLDGQRWRVLQILIAVGSAAVLLLRMSGVAFDWRFSAGLGLIFVTISLIMFRICAGIRENGHVLKEFGRHIGDDAIPDVSRKWRSSSHWVSVFIFVAGLILLFFSGTMFGGV